MKVTILARMSASGMPTPVSGSFAASRRVRRSRAAPAPKPRQEGGRAKEIERIQASETVEVACHSTLEFARLASEPLREQGLLQHPERHARGHFADVRDRAVAPMPKALDGRGRHLLHRQGEFSDAPWRKERREGA